MLRLEIKHCIMILTEKQQKYQLYSLEKLINMSILQVKKYYLPIKEERQNKFANYSLGKAFKKQIKIIEN